eukprot:12657956-Heterocapsa_arctica.AAC.1
MDSLSPSPHPPLGPTTHGGKLSECYMDNTPHAPDHAPPGSEMVVFISYFTTGVQGSSPLGRGLILQHPRLHHRRSGHHHGATHVHRPVRLQCAPLLNGLRAHMRHPMFNPGPP